MDNRNLYKAGNDISITTRFILAEGTIFEIHNTDRNYPDLYTGCISILTGEVKCNNTFGEFYDFVKDRYDIIVTISALNNNWDRSSSYVKIDDFDEYIKSFSSDRLTVDKLINSSVIYHEVLKKCKKITIEELAIEEQIKLKEQEKEIGFYNGFRVVSSPYLVEKRQVMRSKPWIDLCCLRVFTRKVLTNIEIPSKEIRVLKDEMVILMHPSMVNLFMENIKERLK